MDFQTWFVLAPGPSLSSELVDRVKGFSVCVVSNAYEFAPWANCLVSNDAGWWNRHPDAKSFAGRKCSGNKIPGIERIVPCTFGSSSNSGVLALDEVRNAGAMKIVMLGFDMHGTHFFGPYKNGCRNTSANRRREHHLQFASWAKANKMIQVINCTEGTSLKAFPVGSLEDQLRIA